MPSSSSSDSSDYEEMDTEIDKLLCLFCSESFEDDKSFFEHCMASHETPLDKILGGFNDVFTTIKVINYLRKEKPTPPIFRELVNSGNNPWDDQEYLKPVIPNDPVLSLDFDLISGSGDAAPPQDIESLKEQLRIAHEQILAMQKSAKVILDGKPVKKQTDLSIGKLRMCEDSGYIESYAQLGIHEEMLQDTHRTESYRDAIARNVQSISGKNCLDVGCGTGILSMFLARDGQAAKVTGVDFSDIAYSAMDIIRENDLQSVIEVRRGKLEELKLEPYDVIVSEWMGYFLIYENMLDTVIYARDNLLKPGGILLPNKANIYLTITDDMQLYDKYVGYWDDVYGFKMSCMKKPAILDALVSVCRPEYICGSTAVIKEFDLNTVTVDDTMRFSSKFQIESERETTITGLVGFFDTVFDLPSRVVLSTSPRDMATHWKQTTFLLAEPRKIAKNGTLSGSMEIRRSPRDRRGLEVDIVLDDDCDKRLKYNV